MRSAIILVLGLVGGFAAANEQPKRPPAANEQLKRPPAANERPAAPTAPRETGAGLSAAAFLPDERAAILAYYARQPTAGQALPPAAAKALDKGKPLPPGVVKKGLPADLIVALPYRDPRFARFVVGRDVVLVDNNAGRVVDILRDILG